MWDVCSKTGHVSCRGGNLVLTRLGIEELEETLTLQWDLSSAAPPFCTPLLLVLLLNVKV